jgi:predicted Zn-dependent peptidase
LVFDIETTEDAAHQMAYFEGIGAFPVLRELPELLRAVSASKVQAAARKYLQPHQRTIGWYLSSGVQISQFLQRIPHARAAKKETASPIVSLPRVKKLPNGIVLIVRRMTRTPTGFLRVLVSSNNVEVDGEFTAGSPVWGHTSVHKKFLSQEFEAAVQAVKRSLESVKHRTEDPAIREDPEYRLNLTLEELIGVGSNQRAASPLVVGMVGDVDENHALSVMERAFRSWKPVRRPVTMPLKIREREKTVRISGKAQSQFGYGVLAAPPSHSKAYAFRLLLYIMTHGYEGRLGMEMIARKGLIYYISSEFHSDGGASWISIRFGVDPDKLDAARAEFERLLNDLRENPPTEEELSEAKEHLIGRRLTAYQSNDELSGFYVREWVEQGRLLDSAGFERNVCSITLQQLKKIIPEFLNGVTAVVDTR